MAARVRAPRPRRDEVRSQVLAAAAGVFAQRGFAGATIDDVAAAAGFTKGAVYSNFESKDELFLALMDAQVSARLQRVLAEVPSGGKRAAEEIGDRLASVSLEEPDWQLLFLEFWLRAVREPGVREQFVAHRRALRAAIAAAIRQAFASDHGGWAWTPEELTVLALALSNGLAIEALADPATIPEGLFGRVLALLEDA